MPVTYPNPLDFVSTIAQIGQRSGPIPATLAAFFLGRKFKQETQRAKTMEGYEKQEDARTQLYRLASLMIPEELPEFFRTSAAIQLGKEANIPVESLAELPPVEIIKAMGREAVESKYGNWS